MGTKVFFFTASSYARYDRGNDRVDDGYPLPIAGNWSGLNEAGFGSNITAAVNWGNGKVFFFHNDQYVRYDIVNDSVDDGYPLPIAGNWPGFSDEGFAGGIDTAININWGNGKAYFFHNDQYLRYDIASDKVDSGYPLPITGNWPGFSDVGFASGIDAAINWGNGKVFFFHNDQYVRYDIANDSVDAGYPLPIAGNWPGFNEIGIPQT